MTEETLSSGDEILDFEVPWISFAISGACGIRDLIYGRGDLSGVITNVLTDTSSRIACGSLGEWTGALVGVALFGPAGGIIGPGFGAIVGAGIVGKPVARFVRSLLTRSEEAHVRDVIGTLASCAEASMPGKLRAWKFKGEQLADALQNGGPNRAAVRRFIMKRLEEHTTYFDNKQQELGRFAQNRTDGGEPIETVKRLLATVQRAGIHPHKIQNSLKSLFEAIDALVKKRKNLRLG